MNPVGKSDKGRVRENNEDSIFVCGESFNELPNLYVVADGMGGHQAGEVASREAIVQLCAYCRETSIHESEVLDYLVSGVVYANRIVFEMSVANSSYAGMGTTLSLCVLWNKRLYVAHIGDSRIYLINKKSIVQLTADHTFVQEMVKMGHLTLVQAQNHPNRNMITRALGVGYDADVDGYIYDPVEGDKILLCSDGLTNMLSDDEIFEIVNDGSDNETITENLICAANEMGGLDNISVILFDAAAR